MFKLASLGVVVVMLFACCQLASLIPSGDKSPGLPLPGGKLPIPGLGETEIDVTQLGELQGVPVYPNAQPLKQKVKLPGLAGALLGQFKANLASEGVEFGLYVTPDSVAQVTQWYKTQMPLNGWTATPGLGEATEAGGMLIFSSADHNLFILAFEDSETKQTQIFLMRGKTK